jgi:hypothetical protein
MVAVFLNVSNHPVVKWSNEQKNAALGHGRIYDVQYPNVDPTGDDNVAVEAAVAEVKAAVEEVEESVRAEGLEASVVAAMVAGEPISCVAIVRYLQTRGITCYAATTARVSVEQNGVKTSVFQFHHFRPWPIL